MPGGCFDIIPGRPRIDRPEGNSPMVYMPARKKKLRAHRPVPLNDSGLQVQPVHIDLGGEPC